MSAPTADSVRTELGAWLDENWDPGLTLGEWWQRIGTSGWGYPAWPTDAYGRGLARGLARVAIDLRLQRHVYGPPSGIATFLAAPTIMSHGTDEQKARFLPGIVTGRDVWCQLFSEPAAGSDMASLATRAERDGDEWVVTGQKVWNSGAQFANRAILIARTDPDVPKHKGLTYFLIDMDQPGVDVRPLREMTGEAAFNEVFLSEARVADVDRLGAEGEGWRVAMTTLAHERDPANPGVASGGGTTIGRPDLTITVSEHLDRQAQTIDAFSLAVSGGIGRVFDGLVADFGATLAPVARQAIASIHTRRRQLKWSGMRAKAAAKAGQQPGPETSTLKLVGSDLGKAIRDTGWAAMGPHGILADDDAPLGGAFTRYGLFTPAASIAGGTDEVQRNIIGERVLGLPREPDDSRDRPWRELPR